MGHLLFDITPADVQALNDVDARTLVAKLCEAEIRAHGGSAVGLIAGGAQTAPDGGSDVRVTADIERFQAGFISRAQTVFQVKAEPMPKARIRAEIRPRGVIRPILQELAREGGGYVIVSTRDNLAEPSLLSRRAAMTDALGGDAPGLHVDFYDAGRVAFWLQQHPGVVLWVRSRLGRNLSGWSPYGAWSASDRPADDIYLIDDAARLRSDGGRNALSIADGLAALREALGEGKAARLVGLSGHGKTRLAQALFDERVGDGALPQAAAVYGDVGRGVDPAPRAVAEQLAALGRRAVLVVDNCPGSTHRGLVEVARQPGSRLSVLTVEYDVGEDGFEDTAAFRLEAASDDLVADLLKQRAFDLSQTDRGTIAAFAKGNARMALALARSAPKRGSLSALNDAELLERLFGRNPGPHVRAAADIASLVVSFDLETSEGDGAEAPLLAELGGMSMDDLHAAVVELQRRDLVQRRGPWRAVLPQALADRLCRVHLDKLRTERVWDVLVRRAPSRLFASFCHRLGRLHDQPTAVTLAERLLAAAGPLGDPARLSGAGIKAFELLAPAALDAALAALERTLAGEQAADVLALDHPHRARLARLARALAYEPDLFARAISIVAAFARDEPDDFRHEPARDMFEGLFKILLSGAAAPPDVRFDVVRRWIERGDLMLAARAIEASLQAHHFISSHSHDFGARQRDFGWRPRGPTETQSWFESALACLIELGRKDRNAAARVLGARFREAWSVVLLRPKLIACAREIGAGGFAQDLWFEVCETLHYDREETATPDRDLLEQLEAELRPMSVDDLFRAHVLSSGWAWRDPGGGDAMQSIRTSADRARSLGAAAVADAGLLDRHEAELFRTQQSQTMNFGRGYAAAVPDLDAGWTELRLRLQRVGDGANNVSVLDGYLAEAREKDRALTEAWLDAAIDDPVLGQWLVSLQAMAGIDAAAVERLHRALDVGRAPARTYRWLAGGRAMDDTPPDQLRGLLLKLAGVTDGYEPAIDIFGMRLHSERQKPGRVDPAIAEVGRDLLAVARFERSNDTMFAHHLGEVAAACLGDPALQALARAVAERLRAAILDHSTDPYAYQGVATALFRHHPTVALDTFVEDEETWWALDGLVCGIERDPDEAVPQERVPIAAADAEACLGWASAAPETRVPRLAEAIPYAEGGPEGLQWTPLARRLLDGPHGSAALQVFADRFLPGVFWGSFLDQLLRRRPLLEALLAHADSAVASEARHQLARLEAAAEKAAAVDRDPHDQAFE